MSKRERDKDIVQRWIDGERVANIAARYGLTAPAVYAIVEKYGATDRRGEAKPPEPISPWHVRLGQQLSMLRVVTYNQSLQGFADRLRLSAKRLSAIEQGLCDFTVSELERLAGVIGKPAHELIRERADSPRPA